MSWWSQNKELRNFFKFVSVILDIVLPQFFPPNGSQKYISLSRRNLTYKNLRE